MDCMCTVQRFGQLDSIQCAAEAFLQRLLVCAGWNAPVYPYVEQRSLASEVVAASVKIAGYPVCGGWNAPIVPNL